jgi:hypothetical protein
MSVTQRRNSLQSFMNILTHRTVSFEEQFKTSQVTKKLEGETETVKPSKEDPELLYCVHFSKVTSQRWIFWSKNRSCCERNTFTRDAVVSSSILYSSSQHDHFLSSSSSSNVHS